MAVPQLPDFSSQGLCQAPRVLSGAVCSCGDGESRQHVAGFYLELLDFHEVSASSSQSSVFWCLQLTLDTAGSPLALPWVCHRVRVAYPPCSSVVWQHSHPPVFLTRCQNTVSLVQTFSC